MEEQGIDIILERRNWTVRKWFLANPLVHLDSECTIKEHLFIALPVDDFLTAHYHIPPGLYDVEEIITFVEAIEKKYYEAWQDAQKLADKCFNKIYNTPFLDKAPEDAIRSQIGRYETLEKEAEKRHFYWLIINHQADKWDEIAQGMEEAGTEEVIRIDGD